MKKPFGRILKSILTVPTFMSDVRLENLTLTLQHDKNLNIHRIKMLV